MAVDDRPYLNLVHDWTAPLDFTLEEEGAAVNLTGCTVTAVLRDKSGVALALTGSVSVVTPASGLIRWSPAAGDIDAASGPCALRFKVTFGGLDKFYPNGHAIKVNIGV